jgi:hypothetical protein
VEERKTTTPHFQALPVNWLIRLTSNEHRATGMEERKMKSFIASMICIITTSALCEYRAVILHDSSDKGSVAYGISETLQVGYTAKSTPTSSASSFATVWRGSASSKTVIGNAGSQAFGVFGKQVVGWAGGFNAALWLDGTAQSLVNLHPTGYADSWAIGVDADSQVGNGSYADNGPRRALLWHGSANSVVDLHPAGYKSSEAVAVYGDIQAGWAVPTGSSQKRAMLWHGTAASAVSLNPLNCPQSEVTAVWDDYQAGSAYTNGHTSAAIWHGTADSITYLNPAQYSNSILYGACGQYQVGIGYPYSNNYHAMIWSGSSESAIDLHAYLPQEYAKSIAQGVDIYGNVVGYAFLASNPDWGQAVMWQIPEPATMILLAAGGMILRRRTQEHRKSGIEEKRT